MIFGVKTGVALACSVGSRFFCTAGFLIRKFDFAGSKPDLYNRRINAV